MKKYLIHRFNFNLAGFWVLSFLFFNLMSDCVVIGQVKFDEEKREGAGIAPIGVNYYIPEDFWNQKVKIYSKGDTSTICLEKFRVKAMIIDFWSNDCVSCIMKFPKLFAFQQKFSGYFSVLLVNKDGSKNIHSLRNDFLRDHDLPTVYNDQYLNELFPHKGVPHYVWVTPFGRVAAITSAEFADEMRVKAFVDTCIRYEMPHLRTEKRR